MTKIILLLFTLFISATVASASDLSPEKIKWIKKAIAQIEAKGVENLPETKITGGDHQDSNGIWSHYIKKNGKVKFDDGSWIIIVMHSAHSNMKLGDISIIRSSKGGYFYNSGHYCAELNLKSKRNKIASLEDFLNTTGLVSKEIDGSWLPYVSKPK